MESNIEAIGYIEKLNKPVFDKKAVILYLKSLGLPPQKIQETFQQQWVDNNDIFLLNINDDFSIINKTQDLKDKDIIIEQLKQDIDNMKNIIDTLTKYENN